MEKHYINGALAENTTSLLNTLCEELWREALATATPIANK